MAIVGAIMSLIVARKFGNDLIILGDTKLSSAAGGGQVVLIKELSNAKF